MHNSDEVLPLHSDANRHDEMSSTLFRTTSRSDKEVVGFDGVDEVSKPSSQSKGLPAKDRRRFLLLVLLYFVQGIPIGLAFGSVPFLLKSEELTYSQVGIFTLATYPYAMKLFWSPVVDSIFWKNVGRRRSWIIPVQLLSGLCLLLMGRSIDTLLEPNMIAHNLGKITSWFFLLIFLCATQDIAVDGWALTILSKEALSYASTAQTIGINIGYFLSFSIFLALNSSGFANNYLRTEPSDQGLVSLGQYMQFVGLLYLIVTAVVALFVPENPSEDQFKHAMKPEEPSLKEVYHRMFSVLKLKNVQKFIVILLVSKIAFQANDGATDLKLLDKGFAKEDLAIAALIDFPFELVFGYYVARWSSGDQPLRPWLFGYLGRVVAALLGQLLVYCFPESGKVSTPYFMMVIGQHLLSSFMSSVQFVSQCAFHTNIADPAIGGTYMTTLNTLSNMGGQWPRLLALWMIDRLSKSRCVPAGNKVSTINAFENEDFYNCYSADMRDECIAANGVCHIDRDGYYYTNMILVALGLVIYFGFIRKEAMQLQRLPVSSWRVIKKHILPR